MILLEDFYTFLYHEPAPGSVKAKISINPDHKILKGHFPGLPIVPGVCMMQIVREVMEVMTKKSLRLISADTMKFLSVINPDQNREVDVSVTYTEADGRYQINATLFSGEVTFFKIKATLKIS
jgi:3-hydroxyacyl-[acyl-carrier-protein] dehydratase